MTRALTKPDSTRLMKRLLDSPSDAPRGLPAMRGACDHRLGLERGWRWDFLRAGRNRDKNLMRHRLIRASGSSLTRRKVTEERCEKCQRIPASSVC